jgi:hypothetical protein
MRELSSSMSLKTGVAVLVSSLAAAAHAASPERILDNATVMVGQGIHAGSTPTRVSAFLAGHHFRVNEYDRSFNSLSGVALYDGKGAMTKVPSRAVVRVTVNVYFDDKDRMIDYYVEAESPKAASSEDEGPSKNYTVEYGSPDVSCRILYQGYSDHGEGRFYDVSGGKKRFIHKEYVRIGPIVNWQSNSVAELFISEGSPAYHSSYYDCATGQVSPSYFQSIAFDPERRLVATLGDEEIEFYRFPEAKPYYRANVPGLDMLAFFNCDNEAQFKGPGLFHLKSECAAPKGIDADIKLPR